MRTYQTTFLLHSMTRNELRAVALNSHTPRGRSKADTLTNLIKAVELGNLQVKFVATIQLPPATPHGYGKVLFIKKLRTYRPDKVLSPPVPI